MVFRNMQQETRKSQLKTINYLFLITRYPQLYLIPLYFFNHVTLLIPLGRFKYRIFSGSILTIR